MRLVALAVALVVAAGLVVVALSSGGGESGGSELRIERTPGAAGVELVVYVDPGVNEPATAGGKTSVMLECTDSAGASIVRARHGWPFADTDGDTLDPHVHQAVPGGGVERAASCRLRGTRGPLHGEVTDAGIG